MKLGNSSNACSRHVHPFAVILFAEIGQAGLGRRLLVQRGGSERAVVGHGRHPVDDRLGLRRECGPGEVGDVDGVGHGWRRYRLVTVFTITVVPYVDSEPARCL